jgi:hypothetical protein
MSDDQHEQRAGQAQRNTEQRGVVTDVVIPIAQNAVDAAVAAGVGAYVAAKVAKPKGDAPKS